MNDSNFQRYLRVSGYIPRESEDKEIDVVVSLCSTIVSDKSTDERNNSSSGELSSTLLPDKMTLRLDHNTSTSGDRLPEPGGKYIPSTKPGLPGNKNVEEEIDKNTLRRMTTRLRTNKKKSGLRTNKKESGSQILLKSHQKKPSLKTKSRTKMTSPYTSNTTSSSTPHRNKSYKVLVVCSYEKGRDYQRSRDFISKNFYHEQKVDYTFVDGENYDTYFPDYIVDEKYNNYFDMIWFAGCNKLQWLFGISFKKLFNTQQARIKRAYDTLKENGIVIFTEGPFFKRKRTGQSISSFGPDLSMTIDNMNSEPTDPETTRIFKKYFTEEQKGTITFYRKKKSIVNAGRNAMSLQKRSALSKPSTNKSSSSSKRTTGGPFGRSFPHSSNTNILPFPTTSSLPTSSVNSSYHPSLSRTPPQRPINISNKYLISCYMDSVIQCLYWTPGFTTDFLSAEQKGENLIGETFRNIIASYNEDSTYDVEQYTRELIRFLCQYFSTKTGKSGQQDSQEFLTDLLSILTNMYYTDEYVSKPVVEEAPVPHTVREAIEENESTETHSFIQDLFQSTVIKTYTCQKCKTESFKAEYQEIFTLEFSSRSLPSVRFRDLFNTSFREEYLGKSCESQECLLVSHTLSAVRAKKNRHEYDKEYNRYEKALQKIGEFRYDDQILHKKQMRILEPPNNLIIFFKRFETFADGRMNKKIDTIVTDIPGRMNLKNYMYDNNKKEDILYDLYAFIHHSGEVGGGHYINYVKIKDQWWFVDDTRRAIRVITDKDVDSLRTHLAESYILFYTKKE